MSRRPSVEADSQAVPTLGPARGNPSSKTLQQIGVMDSTDLELLITSTFFRLNGVISDLPDMIRFMETEILALRRGDCPVCVARREAESKGKANEPETEVVSLTHDSTDCEAQQPIQPKKTYFVRITLERADEIQPSPVNFPSEVVLARLSSPMSFTGAQILFHGLVANVSL